MTPHDYRGMLMDAVVNGLNEVMFYMPLWTVHKSDLTEQSVLLDELKNADCGTAACIGGHFDLLLVEEGHDTDEFSADDQAGLLEVPKGEWHSLCHGWRGAAWPIDRALSTITRDDAVAALKRLFAKYPPEEES